MNRLILFFLLLSVESGFADQPPNILFAISDDQSWFSCGAYGDPVTRTPAFDRIAREGALFTHAFCGSPSCAPSRSSLLTGRNIWELEEGGILFGKLKSKYRPFTLDLKAKGYQLAATGKTWGPGVTSGMSLYENTSGTPAIFGQQFAQQKLAKKIVGLSGNDYASNFDQFLKSRDQDRPFFFWFGSSEPHQNYAIGRWKEMGKSLDEVRVPPFLPNHPRVAGEFLDYSLEIEHFDQHLARMIQSLENANLLDNTLVVVTSDHGNPMPRSKCNLYDSGTRVPLAVRWPAKIVSRQKINHPVSLVDLAPTLLEAAGIHPPEEMSGRSLWKGLSDPSTTFGKRDFIVTGFERHIICRQNGVGYPMRSIRTRKHAYIRNYEPDRWPAGDPDFLSSHQGFYGDCDRGETKHFLLSEAQSSPGNVYYRVCFGRRPAEELYDMESDPHQLNNLASDPAWQGVKSGLITKMNEYLVRTGDPRQAGKTPWDRYPFSDQRIFQNPDWRREGFKMKLPPAAR